METSGNGNGQRKDRDPKTGRLLPGHQVTVGQLGSSKNRDLTIKVREMKLAECQGDAPRMQKVWDMVAQKALEGDKDFAIFYLNHLMGRPREAMEIKMDGGVGVNVLSLAQVILVALKDDRGAREKVAEAVGRIAQLGVENGNGTGRAS